MKIRRLALTLCLVAFLVSVSIAESTPSPEFVHLSWQNDTSTTMTIMWRTSNEITETVVEYGLTTDYGKTKRGERAALPENRGMGHIVEILNLEPNTLYYYRVGGGGFWSSRMTFKTAPAPTDRSTPIRFVVMGDSRSMIDPGVSHYWKTIIKAASLENPDFIVFNGDAVRIGERQEAWEDWFAKGGEYLSRQPIMMAWGNHEAHEKDVFLRNFALPKNDMTKTQDFYEFRVGSIHYFILDSEAVEKGKNLCFDQQAIWLDEKLRTSDATWNLVSQHRSVFSTGLPHGSDPNCQRYFAALFDKYHVDIDFGGHNHVYERTKPIYDSKPIESLDYSKGTMYIVTGGAGAEMYPFHEYFRGFRLKSKIAHHYVLIEVDGNRLTLTVKSYDGRKIYDKVVLTKPAGKP